jgi:hypothetical protein
MCSWCRPSTEMTWTIPCTYILPASQLCYPFINSRAIVDTNKRNIMIAGSYYPRMNVYPGVCFCVFVLMRDILPRSHTFAATPKYFHHQHLTTGQCDGGATGVVWSVVAWNSLRACIVLESLNPSPTCAVGAPAASAAKGCSMYLHGNMVLLNLSGMHKEARTDWNTVSRSEMNPSSINSTGPPHPHNPHGKGLKFIQHPSGFPFIKKKLLEIYKFIIDHQDQDL